MPNNERVGAPVPTVQQVRPNVWELFSENSTSYDVFNGFVVANMGKGAGKV
jgi:hypothetical protein